MEILQYAITNNRSADGWDVLANTLGALTGLLLMKNKLEKAAPQGGFFMESNQAH